MADIIAASTPGCPQVDNTRRPDVTTHPIAPLETSPAKRVKMKEENVRVPRLPDSNSVLQSTPRCFPDLSLCEPVGGACFPCASFALRPRRSPRSKETSS